MNKSDDAAILTLLTGKPAAELAAMLQLLMVEDDEIVLTESGPANGRLFEIVFCGVTFGIAMDDEKADLSNLKSIFCNLDAVQIQCGIDITLGDHVAGGERVPAIVQALLSIARKIGCACGAMAVMWRPANIVSGFEYFEQSVAEYLSGGAFPVLAMVNFKSVDGGGIATTGLATLCGQELRIECGDMDESEVMRRAVRVVHDMAINGPVCGHVSLDGLGPGERLTLEPVLGTALLKIANCPKLDA